MPRITQPFIRIPWSFAEHPKTEELSDAAVGRLVKAWLYCARNGTDGRLTATQARKVFTPRVLAELLAVEYLYADDEGGGYTMHEYPQHQMTTDTRADLHEKRAAAGAAGGKAKAARQQTGSKTVASATATASKPVPEVRSKSEEEELTTTPPPPAARRGSASEPMLLPVIEVPARPLAEPDRFDEFWRAYPIRKDRADAVRAWAKARRKVPQQTLIDAAQRYADDPHRDPQYTKLGATWLNKECWDNPPEQPRAVPGQRGRVGMTESVTRTLDRAAALQARADQSQPTPYRTAIA